MIDIHLLSSVLSIILLLVFHCDEFQPICDEIFYIFVDPDESKKRFIDSYDHFKNFLDRNYFEELVKIKISHFFQISFGSR